MPQRKARIEVSITSKDIFMLNKTHILIRRRSSTICISPATLEKKWCCRLQRSGIWGFHESSKLAEGLLCCSLAIFKVLQKIFNKGPRTIFAKHITNENSFTTREWFKNALPQPTCCVHLERAAKTAAKTMNSNDPFDMIYHSLFYHTDIGTKNCGPDKSRSRVATQACFSFSYHENYCHASLQVAHCFISLWPKDIDCVSFFPKFFFT